MSTITKTTAGAAVVVSAATGVVTNLVTDQWSWTLGAALAVLVAAGIALAVLPGDAGTSAARRITQRATHDGRITRSAPHLSGDGHIDQTATRGGVIEDSGPTIH